MRRLMLLAIPLAVAAAAFGASRSNRSDSVGSTESSEISVPLSLYVVHEADSAAIAQLSSRRTESGLRTIATRVNEIWGVAGVSFEPVAIHTIEMPTDVLADLMAGDTRSFLDGAGPGITIPEPGVINGFYIPFAGGANGFTPRGSQVFFVADESTVHDERVTSHEIGHILGLEHALDDTTRLMAPGTNGMALLDFEISTARATAAGLTVDVSASLAEAGDDGLLRIANQGSSMEGHTPRGFAGMGTGLFAGDNLNPNFPSGDGVQLFLTFALPDGLSAPSRVALTSDALQVSGTPFDDLGPLRAESIEYLEFGPGLFDQAVDDSAECARVGDNGLTCDVTSAVAADLADGRSSIQFRLRFDTPDDGDGSQDLAAFFRSDPNSNEPGLFVLEISR